MNMCGLDRISHLPDPLRNHIVSFLSVEDVMKTCVLSKRWRFVCESLPRLELDQFEFEKKNHKIGDFQEFVNEVLLRHIRSDIQRFSLKTRNPDASISYHRVNEWISFAIRHNVHDLEVSFCRLRSEKLPHCLFTCNTLMKLSLYCVEFEWTSTPKFPRLKSLTLYGVKFNGNTAQKFFSSCTFPVLEDLTLDRCETNVSTLSILIPTLKYMKFFGCSDIIIDVSVSTLEEIDWVCYNPINTIFEDLSALSSAKFDICLDSCNIGTYSKYKYASKILMGLCHVKKLNLGHTFLELLSLDGDLSTCLKSSNIWNLKHLHLELCPTSVHLQVIELLLRTYPNLQNVRINVMDVEERAIFLETNEREKHCKLEGLPSGDELNCLKIVVIVNFKGSQIELELVKYLLGNAKHMEKLDISYVNNQTLVNSVEMKRINEALSASTRASPCVDVTLSFS